MTVQIEAYEASVSPASSKAVNVTLTFNYTSDQRNAAEEILKDLPKQDALIVVREVFGDLGELLDMVGRLDDNPSADDVADLKNKARDIEKAR